MIHLIQRFISRFLTLNRVAAETHFNSRSDNGKTKRTSKGETRNVRHWCSYCAYAGLPLVMVGCTSLKKAGLVGATSLGVASVTSAFSSGATVPLLAGAATASVTSVVADQVIQPSSRHTGGNMHTAASCAPDNFWTLLGDLVSMGGWLLILVVIIPMVLGWILPGPLERKRKK